MKVAGKVSYFGGPEDMGVSPSEGLAIYEPSQVDEAPDGMFLDEPPPGVGLARSLNPEFPYIATRWDYDLTSKQDLRAMRVLVRAPMTGKMAFAYPADWGPAGPESDHDTGRIADISPGLMEDLGIETDDEVEVIYFPENDVERLRVVISSGHGKYVSGAVGIINEHEEAVNVVNQVAELLGTIGVDVKTFEDTTSHDQNTNLHTIVDFHNKHDRDLDVSVHFNANVETENPMGTECLYLTQEELADDMAEEIAIYGHLKDRGPKERTDLYFLNHTDEPAILIEVCFVDSAADCEAYKKHFDAICMAIAGVIASSKPDALV